MKTSLQNAKNEPLNRRSVHERNFAGKEKLGLRSAD